LLENNGVLPLNVETIGRLAVIGKLADQENTGDRGSSRVRPPYVVTPLAALEAKLGAQAILRGDEDDLDAAIAAAQAADAILVIAGYTAREEGEFIPADLTLGQDGEGRPSIGGDRPSLSLPPQQIALIHAMAKLGKPLIVNIVAGSAVMVEEWRDQVSAILQSFYSGMEGGNALADLLFGTISPSGRLPFTVARDASHYPYFDREATQISYDYWHGYGKFARDNNSPRYAFGHGLSYAQFRQAGLKLHRTADAIEVEVQISNESMIPSDEILFAYVSTPGQIERWPFMLKAFTRLSLQGGESRIARLRIALDDLRYRDPASQQWRFEHGEYQIRLSGTGHDASAAITI
jgi:beta-glucosidase